MKAQIVITKLASTAAPSLVFSWGHRQPVVICAAIELLPSGVLAGTVGGEAVGKGAGGALAGMKSLSKLYSKRPCGAHVLKMTKTRHL